MSRSVICLGERVSLLAPFLPRVVTIRPAFESFERDFLTNVGSAFTLSARVAERISSLFRKPRAAMMCAATVNWTLLTDMLSPTQYAMPTAQLVIIFWGGLQQKTQRSHTVVMGVSLIGVDGRRRAVTCVKQCDGLSPTSICCQTKRPALSPASLPFLYLV